jgi:hypothetical protein
MYVGRPASILCAFVTSCVISRYSDTPMLRIRSRKQIGYVNYDQDSGNNNDLCLSHSSLSLGIAELLQSKCTNACKENKTRLLYTKSHIIAHNVSDTFSAHVRVEYSVCCFYSRNKIIRYVSSLHTCWAFDAAVCSNSIKSLYFAQTRFLG